MEGYAMDNSLVHSLEGCITAVFADLRWCYRSVSDWERDYKRSLHELGIRGERLLTLDFPAIRKHFDKCLEEGLYIANSNIFLTAFVSKRILVPAFLRDLYLQIFQMDGKVRDTPCAYAVAAIRQLTELFGKLKEQCKEEYTNEEVYNFLINETELRTPTLNWVGDDLVRFEHEYRSVHFKDGLPSRGSRIGQAQLFDEPLSLPNSDLAVLQQVCDVISSQFGDLHDEESTELPNHGHGRVSNLGRKESKFTFTDWPAKLDRIFPYDRYAKHNSCSAESIDDVTELGYRYRNRESSSKLIAVPKTMSGPRLIASEPNYHQWIQQLVRNQLERRLRETVLGNCISFDTQQPNRDLALMGSISGAIATVDLKSASDRLSCWTIERTLRSNISLLERIHASRTRSMTNAVNSKIFDKIILKKCFTQGSACTFPVQSIVYSMFCIASVILTNGWKPSPSNIKRASLSVRVFGDDIVVPVSALPKLQEILQFLQLKVNLSKTFHKGKFRESCGLDAFEGVNVTPARIKRFSRSPSHEVIQSMLESANNLFRRGMWRTAEWLETYIPHRDMAIVRPCDSDGLISFCGESFSHLRGRWNPLLQRREVKRSVLISKSKLIPTQSAYDLMQFLCVRPKNPGNLGHLGPACEDKLGIVDKKSSVMKTGWMVHEPREPISGEQWLMANQGA